MLQSIATTPHLVVVTPQVLRQQAADLARQAKQMQRAAARLEAEDEYRDLVAQADRWVDLHDDYYQHCPQYARICELERMLGY